MLDAAPEAITIFDADRGTYELANRKALEMFGIPRTAVTTVRPADLRPPRQPDGRDSDELIRANVERALAGETVSFEWTAVRYDDGRPVPCEVRLVRFPAEGRNLVRVSVVGIGERLAQRERERELSAQLQHARRLEAVGTFTGGVAHDFNNLLQVIRGNLELLQMEVRGDPDAYSLVDASMYAADRGAVLTRELLAFARQQPLTPVTIDLRSEMDDLTLLIARTMGEELALRVDVPEDVWLLHADRAQLQNALLNLALNAHEAMPGGGTLRITAENATVDVGDSRSADMVPGDYVAIAVSDEGTGMDADVLPHIFEPFWTTKDVGEGSGLGLSMVHGFAGQSGGFVTVRSAVGRGTTVRIFLPRRIPVA
ncbi:MAG: PAS domain-containing sensor histidine kinase [Gemmatimonadetes bacterium]|nr:MAG: PAS domain-containing sensor histidine kinase [Gemmatimonadota bacterium]